MSALADWYRPLPRAARWGIVAVGLLAVYFVIIEPTLDLINRANSTADERSSALISLANKASGGSNEFAVGIKKFGDILLPEEQERRSVAFNRRFSEILQKHKVKDNSTWRNSSLGSGPIKDAYGDSERIEREVREVQFDATPEEIAAVISDLESAPEVAAVSKVQIRRGDQKDTAGRVLKVTIAAEAWEIVKKGRSR